MTEEAAGGEVVRVGEAMDSLFPFQDLLTRHEEWTDQGLRTVQAIGDALAPSTIAAAVWEGRRYAKELEAPTDNSDTTPASSTGGCD